MPMNTTDDDLIRFNRRLIALAGETRACARRTREASALARIARALSARRDETWAYQQAVWASAVTGARELVDRAKRPVG